MAAGAPTSSAWLFLGKPSSLLEVSAFPPLFSKLDIDIVLGVVEARQYYLLLFACTRGCGGGRGKDSFFLSLAVGVQEVSLAGKAQSCVSERVKHAAGKPTLPNRAQTDPNVTQCPGGRVL